jgi:DNA-binding transcriptional regulator LsrR (DeoR family)
MVPLSDQNYSKDRQNLLADIAELYFLEEKTQAEIAEMIGVTRSNVSRMLTEAKNSGIVLINIKRSLQENIRLEKELIDQFNLVNARVIDIGQSSRLLSLLGQAASEELTTQLKPGWIIGTSWGTAISATVEEIANINPPAGIRIIQLLGALGARIAQYDAHAIVRRLAEKLDAEGVHLNAPFLVENHLIAQSLLINPSIEETLTLGKRANIALLGVGSADLETSSYYLANYVSQEGMKSIQNSGAIGDVCGRFYDINGNMTAFDFQNRLIGISAQDLRNIPLRIGVAGGPAKVEPIIGALRSNLINILVSDSRTVSEVLARIN